MEEQLRLAAATGYLSQVKAYEEYEWVPFRAQAGHCLKEACKRGHLHVMQWIQSIFKLSKHDLSYAFQWACASGYLQIAQWLHVTYHLTPLDAKQLENYALRWSCAYGHLNVVQWLHVTFGLTILDVRSNPDILSGVCCGGRLNILRWLVTTFGLTIADIRTRNYDAIYWADSNGHLSIIRWLHNWFGITAREILAHTIYAEQPCHKRVKQWVNVTFKESAMEWTRSSHRQWYWQAEVIVCARHIPRVLLTDVLRRVL